MATLQSLADLGQTAQPAAPEAPKYVQKLDAQGRAYATGKRKDAVARVWIKPGSGQIVVNSRPVEVYFARPVLRMILQAAAPGRKPRRPVRHRRHGHGRRSLRPGRRRAPRPRQGADPLRARTARAAQEGRLPYPRCTRRRAQEVRQEESPPQLPVLEALKTFGSFANQRAASGRLFLFGDLRTSRSAIASSVNLDRQASPAHRVSNAARVRPASTSLDRPDGAVAMRAA